MTAHGQPPGHGVRSRAALGGHPLHPMMVPFPLAFLTAALVTDALFVVRDNAFWAQMSYWLLMAGTITGVLAAVLGLVDFLSLKAPRSYAAGWIHFLGNAGVLVLSAGNVLLRVGQPASAVLPWGLVLSAVVTALLVVTGWCGGELSYRHRIGVIPGGDG